MGLTSGFNLSPFLKGKEFVKGLTVRIIKTPTLEDSNDPKFGFKDGENKGKVLRFTFMVDGGEKLFDATSKRFCDAMDPFEVGANLHITRTGEGMDTDWIVKAV